MSTFDAIADLDFPVAVVVTSPEADLETYGEVDTVFPWASVTKPVAAMAALVAVERGMVSLDDPVGPPGATLRHLLAHAGGVAFDSDQVIGEPGRRRIYSNRGIELMADHVAAAVGTEFARWVEESVLEPLHMATVLVEGSPAHAGEGSAEDLARFARELLAPTLIGADLHREATRVVFPGLSGVLPGHGRQENNDWGLGFEIRDQKKPHWTGETSSPATFGHFGQTGSFLWVDTERDLAAVFLGAKPYGSWAAKAWPPLTDAILAAHG